MKTGRYLAGVVRYRYENRNLDCQTKMESRASRGKRGIPTQASRRELGVRACQVCCVLPCKARNALSPENAQSCAKSGEVKRAALYDHHRMDRGKIPFRKMRTFRIAICVKPQTRRRSVLAVDRSRRFYARVYARELPTYFVGAQCSVFALGREPSSRDLGSVFAAENAA